MVPLKSRSLVNDGTKTTSGGHAARERLLRGSDELTAQLVFQTFLNLQHCCLLEVTSSSSLNLSADTAILNGKSHSISLEGRALLELTQKLHALTHAYNYSTEAPKKAVCSALTTAGDQQNGEKASIDLLRDQCESVLSISISI